MIELNGVHLLKELLNKIEKLENRVKELEKEVKKNQENSKFIPTLKDTGKLLIVEYRKAA